MKTVKAKKQTQIVWISKYALTRGIYSIEAIIKPVEGAAHTIGLNSGVDQYFPKGTWASTEDEAKTQAEKLRFNRIKALQKQLDKLQKMEF